MNQITREQAIALFETEWWKSYSHRELALFQLENHLLCMPFDVFHEAIEKALGRPVYTHEMGLNWEGLLAELQGEVPAPSLEEIINLIPKEKWIIIIPENSHE